MMARIMSRREENYERRRGKLLSSARALFDRQGYEATTVGQIAKASKSALRTVYNVFPAKIDILAALIATEATSRLATGLADMKQEHGDPQQRLLRLFEILARIFTGGPRDEIRLVTAHAISSGRTTLTGQIYDDMDKEIHNIILSLLQEFQSDRSFRKDVEVEPLARLIYNAVNGVFYRWLGDDTMTEAQSFEQMEEHLAILLPPMESERSRRSVRIPSPPIRRRGRSGWDV